MSDVAFSAELRRLKESGLWKHIEKELIECADISLRNAGSQDISTEEGRMNHGALKSKSIGLNLAITVIEAMMDEAEPEEVTEDE